MPESSDEIEPVRGGVGEGPLGSNPLPAEQRQHLLSALEEAQAELERMKRREEDDGAPKVVDKCSACGGDVVEETRREYDPSLGPPIIGPGYRHQQRRVTAFYCADCGLVYRRPPKQMKKIRTVEAVRVETAKLPEQRALPLGWTIKEYTGPEVFASLEDLMTKKPITEREALRAGTDCYTPSAFQAGVAWNLKVLGDPKDGEVDAEIVGSRMTARLVFDRDDRHCWVAACFSGAQFTPE